MPKWRLALIGCFASCALVLGGTALSAQDAGGTAQCLVGCAKSDKPCQDSCVPSAIVDVRAHACLAHCRRSAKDPDLVLNLKACIGRCLHGAALIN